MWTPALRRTLTTGEVSAACCLSIMSRLFPLIRTHRREYAAYFLCLFLHRQSSTGSGGDLSVVIGHICTEMTHHFLAVSFSQNDGGDASSLPLVALFLYRAAPFLSLTLVRYDLMVSLCHMSCDVFRCCDTSLLQSHAATF